MGTDNVIKAVTCNIPLGKSVLDAYMLPDGEKRFGIEKVTLALNYPTKQLFFERTKRQSKSLRILREDGFSGEQVWVSVIGQGEDSGLRVKTISLRDFIKLLSYEALHKKNKNALILITAFAETGLEKIVDYAFEGKSIEFLLEKIVHFTKWTYEELEEVLEYNRQELRELHPWGLPRSLQ